MRSDQKRERPGSSSASSKTPTTSSLHSTISTDTDTASSASSGRRQQLQRGAKDKAYAARLAADYGFGDDNHRVRVRGGNSNEGHNDQLHGRECAATKGSSIVTITEHAASARTFDGDKSVASSQRRCDDNNKRKRKRNSFGEAKAPTSNGTNTNTVDNQTIRDLSNNINEEQIHSFTEYSTTPIYEGRGTPLSADRLMQTNSPTTPPEIHFPAAAAAAAAAKPSPAVAAVPEPSAAPPNDWSCTQCTCFNSSRRKKCQACGIPRYLMVNSDGTFKLDELAKEGGGPNNNNCGCLCLVESLPIFSQVDASQQQLQLFAMMDAPVSTRSKRKEQLSQTQSLVLTQTENGNGSTFCQFQSDSSSLGQYHDSQHDGGGGRSGFQQWIRKRHSAKREKRQRFKSLKNGNRNSPVESASLGQTISVTVRIRSLLRGGGSPLVHHHEPPKKANDDQSLHLRLTADIPTAVIARVQVRSNIRPTDNDNGSDDDRNMVEIEEQLPKKDSQQSPTCEGSCINTDPICMLESTSSSVEMKSVTIRIRSLIGDEVVTLVHLKESPENPDIDQSSPLQLTADIPKSVLARISLRPDIQLEYKEIEKYAHTNDINNDFIQVSIEEQNYSEKLMPCDGRTGDNSIRLSGDNKSPDAGSEGSDTFCDTHMMSNQLPFVSGMDDPVSSLEGEMQSEDIASHQAMDVSRPIEELSNDLQPSQGSFSNEAPFIPMTQQLHEFDYLSQVSQAFLGTPKSACDDGLKINDTPRTSHGFTSAGSASLIRISDKSLVRATELLADNSDCLVDRAMTYRNEYDTDATVQICETSSISFGFTASGSGALIRVSDESLSRASKLIAEDKVDQEDGGDATFHDDYFPSSTNAREIYPSSFDAPRSNLGFACAGSGALITVSEESLSRASKLLADSIDGLVDQHDDVDDAISPFDGVTYPSCTNTESKAITNFDIPRTTLGFASAGSGAMILISDENLSRASKLLADSNDRSSPCNNEHDIETSHTSDDGYPTRDELEKNSLFPVDASSTSIGFACAGSGAMIRVSDESLSRASKLFAESKNSDDDDYTHSHDNRHPSSNCTKLKHPTSVEAPNAFFGFASAGSGALIRVSDESLSRASTLLADTNDCSVGRGIEMIDDEHNGNNDATSSFNDDNYPPYADITTKHSTTSDAQFTSFGFASAGSGALIRVSDESLSNASKLFAGANYCLVDRGMEMLDDEHNDNDDATQPFNDDNYPSRIWIKTKHISTFDTSRPSFGFASAGSGALISVSDESLSKASKLLADANDCLLDQTIPFTGEHVVETSRTSRGESEKKNLPSVNALSDFNGFTSAGSGASILTSDESLSKASKLLTGTTVQHGNDAEETSPFNDDSSSSLTDSTTKYSTTFDAPRTSFGFANAGSGALISITDESLSRASKLLAEIDVEDQAGMRDYNHDVTNFQTSEDGPPCTDIVRDSYFVKLDGDKRSSDRKLDTVRIAISDAEDTRNCKDRRHGNQKVRFSLDASQSTTNRQCSGRDHDFQVELTNEEFVANEDHAPHVRSHAMCLTVLRRRSLITPDNRDMDQEREHALRNCNQSARRPVPEVDIEIADTESKSYTPFLCESGLRVNVVTDRKDAEGRTRTQSTSFETVHHSPHDKYVRTPLHEMTNIVDDPFQSVMKSKRLFQSAAFEGNELQKTRNMIKPVVDRSIFAPKGVSTLSQFAANHNATEASSWEDCIKYGVKDATMRVTSANAIKLRFSSGDDSPLFFFGQRDPPKCKHVGKVSDISEWLCRQECDKSLISDKWILNHVRWIVWKLAAMERRFPIQLGGHYLTYSHVLSQIKGRYEKELRAAKRPALRKVLNRDVSACMPIVLCVSQILRFKIKQHLEGGNGSGKSENNEEVRLELSDGWYAVSALLDSVLTSLINGGKIRVGSKLMICNAQLVGSDDGVDPLDENYFSDRLNCPLLLKISSNNTRLASWDAKLGFVHPKFTVNQGGGILVKSLSDIFPDGGNIPAIDLVICKRYPQMFLEQVKNIGTQIIATNHLTEAEEAARQNDHDMSQQRTSERYADNACQECSEEIDEDAPTEWKEMVASNSPEDYYANLTESEQNIVDDWTTKRHLLMQNKVAKSIEDAVKDHSHSERTSLPYLRVLVKAFCRSKQKGRRQTNKQSKTAELTIWRVTEEQLHLMKEGTVVRMKNVAVKSDHDGMLQLSAKCDTQMEPLPAQPTQFQLIRSGYEERRPKSLIYINLIAKKLVPSRLAREVDLVACIVKMQRLDSTTSAAYLTDESGFVMKLIRTHTSNNNDPFQLGNVETSLPTVVELCNVEITSYDTADQCAIGAWGIFTCKARHSMRLRHDEVQDWCNSASGIECCSSIIIDRINVGIPSCITPFNRCMLCIGYILGFEVDGTTLEMNVIVDYGEEFSLVARIPFYLLLHALRLNQSNSSTSDGVDLTSILTGSMFKRTNILSTCCFLGEYFQQNQMLFRFIIEKASCYGVDSLFHTVTGMSVAATDSLCRLSKLARYGDEVLIDGIRVVDCET